MSLFDTHCHIHEAAFPGGCDEAYDRALLAGVDKLICVGTDDITSVEAVDFAARHKSVWATVGLHPHEAIRGDGAYDVVEKLATSDQVVAIGEIGLDYFYDHSPRDVQIAMLRRQLQLAEKHNLAVVFHVREAFEDFWPIVDQFNISRAVLHSFTDATDNMRRAVARGWFIGVNGISTFTKSSDQIKMFDQIPIESMVLETDAPFLTPVPYRGKVNEPAFVEQVAVHHADRREMTLEQIAQATTTNAQNLFHL